MHLCFVNGTTFIFVPICSLPCGCLSSVTTLIPIILPNVSAVSNEVEVDGVEGGAVKILR